MCVIDITALFYQDNDYLNFPVALRKTVTPVYLLYEETSSQKTENCWRPLTFLTTGPFVMVMVVAIKQYIDRMLRFW